MTAIRSVAVIGVGQMGAGIAQAVAMGGYSVILYDPAPEPGDGFGPPMMPFPFYSPYYAPYYPWWGGYPGRW